MKFTKIITFIIFIFCLGVKTYAQYITVDDTKTPQQLIENVLIHSPCATVTNPQATGDTYTTGRKSFAYFNAGTSDFPFKEGVILSSGSSQNAIGPFTGGNNPGGNILWLGDSDLDQALGIKSVNATVLEFDFIPLTNFVSFNYIFASNEYQSYYPCQYSDGFAFLIKEANSTQPYKNLAVLPNSNTPVSSMNVHPKIEPVIENGFTRAGCAAVNENYFQGFNAVGSGAANYAGQTKVMKSQTDVIAGRTYHIKLVVADSRTQYYDSAVFLEGGSFGFKINLGPDRESSTNNPVCDGEGLTLDTQLYSPPGANYTYEWYKNGAVIPTATNAAYTVREAGDYKVNVAMNSSCSSSAQIKIEYAPKITVTNTTLINCDPDMDNSTTFDLTKATGIIKNNDSTLNAVYYRTLAEAQAKQNAITTPGNYTTTSGTIYARVENSYGCAKYAELNLKISNNAIPPQNPVAVCDGDTDGLYEFNLNTKITPQLLTGLPSGLLVNYYLTENDAITDKNPLPNPNNFKNTIPFNQTIYARIINGSECYGITPIQLIINVFNPPDFGDETISFCRNTSINLAVPTGFATYLWNTGSTSNMISVTNVGDYSVTVSDINGCTKTKKFKVVISDVATITGTKIKDFSANENSVLVEFTGNGNYEFSLNGTDYQDNTLFESVSAGIYKVYVRDKNGCGATISDTFYVLDYPRFFTPNGDGYNDVWKIKNLNIFPNYAISIFDRYGRLLKVMNSTSVGWDGTYNGTELPADDYWFVITFEDRKSIKGHFSLKR